MAKANYNATLEYAANTVEFWWSNDAGEEEVFGSDTKFYIERADGSEISMEFSPILLEGGHVTFSVEPDKSILYKEGDTIYDYDNQVFEHIYSVRSSDDVYVSGKLNLIEVA